MSLNASSDYFKYPSWRLNRVNGYGKRMFNFGSDGVPLDKALSHIEELDAWPHFTTEERTWITERHAEGIAVRTNGYRRSRNLYRFQKYQPQPTVEDKS